MKKFYILGLALAGLTLNAQFTDDFESYPTGPYFGGHWSTWSGSSGAENILIAEDGFSTSGTKAGFIPNDNVVDALLKLGDKTSGVWTVQWETFINFASTGYYNFQEKEVIIANAGIWGLNIFFNKDAAAPSVGQIEDDANPANILATFPYNEEEWVTLTHVFDLDAGTAKVLVNGTEVYNGEGYLQTGLGGIDFYSIDTSNAYYIDDVVFAEGDITMGVNDVSGSTISIYPTVSNDVVNVSAKSNISEVSVYNMNGQQVLKVAGQGTTAQVNVSALPAGTYVVKTVAGKETKSTKVVVK